ncbi:MAG TPA: hypothetical protein VKX46_14580 [Ktedonobacteraceae bacterium]|nr:hypothetical protein [Ktedonobacteraceae bacterium]
MGIFMASSPRDHDGHTLLQLDGNPVDKGLSGAPILDLETQRVVGIVTAFQRDLEASVPQAVIDYFTLVLASSIYPEGFPQKFKLVYVPESKQLVLEY